MSDFVPCVCYRNGCYMQHTECLCGCPRGRAHARNVDECLRIIAANRDVRAEWEAKYGAKGHAVSAGNRGDASPRAGDTRSGEGITGPTAPSNPREAYYDHKRRMPF